MFRLVFMSGKSISQGVIGSLLQYMLLKTSDPKIIHGYMSCNVTTNTMSNSEFVSVYKNLTYTLRPLSRPDRGKKYKE